MVLYRVCVWDLEENQYPGWKHFLVIYGLYRETSNVVHASVNLVRYNLVSVLCGVNNSYNIDWAVRTLRVLLTHSNVQREYTTASER